MAKSATFSVLKASAHSSAHNSREDNPEYLIGFKDGNKNSYDLRHSDSDFLELAKVKYQEVTGQKMQQKQIDALIKETVLSLEDHHTEADVQKVFDTLNEKYGGHYITELSIHKDEGHFEDKNGITYYPTKDILQKEDAWYIVPLIQSLEMKPSYKPKEYEFIEKVDINDFKPIHNIHAHVKFSMFDLEMGKTGRMKHNELNDRIKTAARVLKLEYNPEKTVRSGTAVSEIKTRHKVIRNEKIKALIKGLKSEHSLGEKYDSLPMTERLEMRAEMRSIIGDSIETDTLNKRLELSERENKSLKEEIQALKEAQKEERAQLKEHGATRADYAQMEAKYKAEIAQLKAGNAPKTAVDVSKEIEEALTKIGEMARIATSNAKVIEELEKAIPTDDPKKVAIAVYNSHIVADTGIMGKLGGEKKDTDLLITNMAKEIEKRDNLIKKAFDMLKKDEITKMSVSSAMKNVVESTKKHLEAIFSKITGKSLPEVKKEREELVNAKPRGLREAVDELNKQKEPEKGIER